MPLKDIMWDPTMVIAEGACKREIKYKTFCPDVCPKGWEEVTLGEMVIGPHDDPIFYPWGSVAAHFWDMQREHRRKSKRTKTRNRSVRK